MCLKLVRRKILSALAATPRVIFELKPFGISIRGVNGSQPWVGRSTAQMSGNPNCGVECFSTCSENTLILRLAWHELALEHVSEAHVDEDTRRSFSDTSISSSSVEAPVSTPVDLDTPANLSSSKKIQMFCSVFLKTVTYFCNSVDRP